MLFYVNTEHKMKICGFIEGNVLDLFSGAC